MTSGRRGSFLRQRNNGRHVQRVPFDADGRQEADRAEPPAADHAAGGRPWPVEPSAHRIDAARALLREFPARIPSPLIEPLDPDTETLLQLCQDVYEAATDLDTALRDYEPGETPGGMQWQ